LLSLLKLRLSHSNSDLLSGVELDSSIFVEAFKHKAYQGRNVTQILFPNHKRFDSDSSILTDVCSANYIFETADNNANELVIERIINKRSEFIINDAMFLTRLDVSSFKI